MGTVLELSNLELATRTQGRTGTVLARIKPAAAVPESAWLTATIRPAGTFGRNDASRLRVLLDALSACASIVLLDLQAARLRSHRAAEVIEDAAWDTERRGAPTCASTPPPSHGLACPRSATTPFSWTTNP